MDAKEAYRAMYIFLSHYTDLAGNDAEIGGLLGEMSTLVDGRTADPAIETEWLAAVEEASKTDDSVTRLILRR